MKSTSASFLLLLTACIWGAAFVAQRAGMDYVGSFTFNGVRFLLGALSLIPVIAVFEKHKPETPTLKPTLKAGLIGGVVLFAAASLQQLGIEITLSAGRAGFITGLYIVLTPIMGMVLGKKPGREVVIGAALACVGLYLLTMQPGIFSVGLGDLALIGGAFVWAVHILLIDHYANRIYPLRFASMQFMVCGLLSLLSAFLFEEVSLAAILDGYVPILYGGLLSVGVAYTLQIIGQRKVAPAKAALIFSTESLFSAVAAAVLLGEFLSTRAYIGGGLILTGVLASQLSAGRRG